MARTTRITCATAWIQRILCPGDDPTGKRVPPYVPSLRSRSTVAHLRRFKGWVIWHGRLSACYQNAIMRAQVQTALDEITRAGDWWGKVQL